jgi:hypothetical protein
MSERSLRVKSLPCIACRMLPADQCQHTEEHHLCISSGQKRLGDEFSIPLCVWHHRGDPAFGTTAGNMENIYGPSLARNPKAFRAQFGEDSLLLHRTNKLLEAL